MFFVYTANIIGKTSFSAATAALVSENILSKTEAGVIGAGFWFLYAGDVFRWFYCRPFRVGCYDWRMEWTCDCLCCDYNIDLSAVAEV